MSRTRTYRTIAVLLVSVVVLAGCEALSYMPGTPRPGWCDPTDTAINDGNSPAFFAAYPRAKGPLSQVDCLNTANYLNLVRDYAARFPTVAAAQAAGWIQATVWTPGQGIHFVDPTRLYGPFDPMRPNYLNFNGTAPNSALMGMMFLTESGAAPPAGFPGGNDHWHNHSTPLCYKANSIPYIVGEGISNALCAGLGGVNTDFSTQWMVHVWLPIYAGWDATDIFNNSHPAAV